MFSWILLNDIHVHWLTFYRRQFFIRKTYTHSFQPLQRKPYFLFLDVMKRWSFQKIALEYDLSCIIVKDHVSLSRKCDLNLRRKMKNDLFQKQIQGNMIFSSGLPKRSSFQKGPRRDMIFLVLSGKMTFFFPKTRYFFLGQGASNNLTLEIHGNVIFSVYTCGCFKPGVTPPCQKNQGWPYPAKIHLKVIGVLDWHPGKSSSNSLYLYRDLYGNFHVLLSCGKKQKT